MVGVGLARQLIGNTDMATDTATEQETTARPLPVPAE